MSTFVTSLPALCFDRDVFLRSGVPDSVGSPGGFHVEEFISKSRQVVSLETLLSDLQVFLKSLRNELVELINRDYADFVNLSSNLVGMDKVIGDIKQPLKQMREEVVSVQKSIHESIQAVQSKLDERASVREKKATLRLFLNISASLEKIENLLLASGVAASTPAGSKAQLPPPPLPSSSSFPGGGGGGGSGTEREDVGAASTRLIERVAGEFNQLQFYVSQGKHLPFVENLHSRIAFITNTLAASLESAFTAALQTNNRDVLIKCFRTYALMDKAYDAEAVFRRQVVSPHLHKTITPVNLNAANGLETLLDRVLQFADEKVLPMHEVIHESGSRGYDLLVNTLWPEVVDCLCHNIASIFAPAIPQNFHKNYTAVMSFVRNLERKCGSHASIMRLREHEAYRTLQDKWNLSVYFQLRFHEIASEFETALQTQLNAPTAIKPADAKSEFSIHTTAVLWLSIHSCWSPSVYIYALSHRFWKLTLQAMARYTSWIRKELDAFSTQLSASASAASNAGGSGNAGTDSSPQALKTSQIGVESAVQGLILIATDIETLSDMLPGFYTATVQARLVSALANMDESQTKNMKDAFAESISALRETLAPVEQLVITALIDSCIANLNPVRSVKSMYRMTNKEMPSKASTYVPLILRPLASVATALSPSAAAQFPRRALPFRLASEWIKQVAEALFRKMLEICQEEIATVRKTEDSLNRLKKARKSAAPSSASEVSDTDKIQKQFQLDAEALGEQIDGFGMDSKIISSLGELKLWASTPLPSSSE